MEVYYLGDTSFRRSVPSLQFNRLSRSARRDKVATAYAVQWAQTRQKPTLSAEHKGTFSHIVCLSGPDFEHVAQQLQEAWDEKLREIKSGIIPNGKSEARVFFEKDTKAARRHGIGVCRAALTDPLNGLYVVYLLGPNKWCP